MATTNYDINYNDKRFQEVEADKKAALNDVDVTYGNMISNSDKYYQNQIDAAQDYADKQTQLQQEQTDFAIDKIEQEKAQAKKDYLKEQSGAYVDWQKQSNQYGVNAEQMAASGMENTGYRESSLVSMYNTYQNRVATARAAYDLAVQNYNNSIMEARLQNNSVLAEIAYEALQKQLELSLQGFQYKNNLILEKAQQKIDLDNTYYARYQDVLKQINTENALAEEVRQYDNTLELKQDQLKLQQDEFEWEKAQAAKSSSISKGSSGGSSSKGSKSATSSKSSSSSGISKTSTKSTSKSKGTVKSSATPTVDMKSVLALGYGPISAAQLDKLVSQGVVEEYTEGGKVKFRKVFKK